MTIETTRVEQLLAEISTQSRIANRLLAAQLKSTMKQSDLIDLLSTTGASLKEIAAVLGTSVGTVNTARVRLRKGRVVQRNGRSSSRVD
jgi:DNA-binding CsgD family transcriptional regulator